MAVETDVLLKLRMVFRDVFDDDELEISMATSKGDIEDWDSVAQVKLVLSIQELFGIRFTTEEVSTMKSVGDFADAIIGHEEDSSG